MPHFRYLDRYWNFAGDELSVPSLCSITARLLWTCLIAVVYGISYQHLQQCDDNWLLQTYLLVSILLFIATIFCDGLIIQVSLKGTIIAQGERSQLSKHLNLKIALTFLQVLCGIFGILSLSLGSDLPCNQDVESSMVSKVFVAIVASSQLLDMVVLFCCCYCLQARGKDHEEMLDESLVLATWESRCRTVSKFFQYFLCNLFGGGNVEEGFEQVAKVFTAFFHHNGFLDVVPSDVVAGIVLVRVEQRKRRKNRNLISSTYLPIQRGTTNSLKSMNISSNSNEAFDLAITEDQNASRGVVSNLDEIDCWLRCSTFSLAMYTHIMVLYMNPCTGPCKLCCHDCMNGFCSCGTVPLTSISKSELLVEGDNCCRLNNTGMKIFTNYLQNSELLYVSYKNDTTHKPFGVFLDHDKEWLVIAVRGTLSLEDCITDVTCEPVELDQAGELYGFDGKNRWAHGGMLKAAMHIRNELQRTGILMKFLGKNPSNNSSSMRTPLTQSTNHMNYKLVVTGHSLGAGTAVILSMLLKNAFPGLHCYSFGTPGSVVDELTCKDISSYVTSIVLGNDLVSRLNFQSLCNLRKDTLDAISRAKVNKMVIMKAMLKDMDPDDLLHAHGKEPPSEFRSSVERFHESINNRLKVYHGKELRLPGRVIHLVKVANVKKCCFKKPRYLPVESDLSDFTDILVSSSMGADHLPDRYFLDISNTKESLLHGHFQV